jgi:UDP-N-acetylmuramyl-tripeptide synthetase
MKLSDLLSAPSTPIKGIAFDSRHVQPGDLFFALQGAKIDGSGFIQQALDKGAVAVIGSTPFHDPRFYHVDNARSMLSLASSLFYPQQPETIVAITGTSGKTSVAAFVRQLFDGIGGKSASLGTIGVVKPSGETYGSLTTPDPVTLHKTLHELAREGVTHLAFEASSHGLDQNRLDNVRIKAAGFTNLSRDHLDYHHDLESYLQAKLRLFTDILPENGTVVVNEGEFAHRIIEVAKKRDLELITIGGAGSTLGIRDVEQTSQGQKVTLELYGRRYFAEIPLIGRFQIENLLMAAGLCMACGITLEEVLPQFPYIDGAKGRLEEVGRKKGAPIIVDYAHKPDALEKVLETLRPFTKGRLIVVFGCGGDRDKGKRPLMGEIAARLADICIITDDNPRSEEASTIRAEIKAACPNALDIGDRASAIYEAISMASPDDLVVIAGKGHETGQLIAGVTHPFSDHEVAKKAIKDMR